MKLSQELMWVRRVTSQLIQPTMYMVYCTLAQWSHNFVFIRVLLVCVYKKSTNVCYYLLKYLWNVHISISSITVPSKISDAGMNTNRFYKGDAFHGRAASQEMHSLLFPTCKVSYPWDLLHLAAYYQHIPRLGVCTLEQLKCFNQNMI